MKCIRDKPEHLRQGFPPVGPCMSTIPYPEFMRDVVFFHCNMHQAVSFVKEIVITTVNIPPYKVPVSFGLVVNK